MVVEGRTPLCWVWKQLGHFARSCAQKTTTAATKTNETTNATTTKTAEENKNPDPKTGDHPNEEEGWTQVKVKKTKKKKNTSQNIIFCWTTISCKITNSNRSKSHNTNFNSTKRHDNSSSSNNPDTLKKQKKNSIHWKNSLRRWKHIRTWKGGGTVVIQLRRGKRNDAKPRKTATWKIKTPAHSTTHTTPTYTFKTFPILTSEKWTPPLQKNEPPLLHTALSIPYHNFLAVLPVSLREQN